MIKTQRSQGVSVVPSNSKYCQNLKRIVLFGFVFIGGHAFAKTEAQDTGSFNKVTSIGGEVNTGEKELEAVSVSAPSEVNEVEKYGFNIDVISTEEYLNSSKDINQVLNATPGVIIRNEGGLGSSFKLSINGLSDNQIRYFIDGIPMEDFGSSLTLDNYPINLVQGIEVYKGVVPINLSSDALGGAINIITPGLEENYADISHSTGSFNTRRTAINTNYNHNDYLFSRISAFWNSSDNDYNVNNIPDTDEFGNIEGIKSENRFHDKYQSRMFSWKNGVIKTDWADEFSVNLILADNEDEIQHAPASIDTVFGGLYSEGSSLLSALNYKKQWQKFSMSGYFLTGEVKETYFNTESRRYQWDGSYEYKTESRGELNGVNAFNSVVEIKDEVARTNIHGQYEISSVFSVSSGISYNRTVRSGEDKLDDRDIASSDPTSVNVRFEDPMSINKTVSALSLNYIDFGSGSIFYKNYQLSATVDEYNPTDGSDVNDTVNQSLHGFGLTYRYPLFDGLAINTSYEKSVRLPEIYELLGDGGIFIRPSPLLEPEKSNNLNLGLKYDGIVGETVYLLESNLFYRNAKDFIRFNPDQPVTGVYENVEGVEVKGIELSSVLSFSNSLSVNAAITYQDIISSSKTDQSGGVNFYYGARVPNEPYFFANINIAYSLFDKSYNQYSINWSSRFVHEYYLWWEVSGNPDEKDLIDTQIAHDLEVSASFLHQTYNVSLAVNNLLNEDVYDNYRIQKPGRSYALKLRYNY